ncbi:SRPBCC family protein [Actinacidiphila acidipaludis]|uniref:SRPBCC family protein n=1 Tax=Actinacidiphila acidipaludis TaxID=2873382 RepID=A0ABS7QG27_9ACTN|nr:SRPBCC family protein [Streptomyces acidipaludis]MBY8880892.1 SRPBCC family protein [Streptomyces acidipaludis]
MNTFAIRQRFDAPAATVWDLIGDFYSVGTWMPGVAGVVADTTAHTRTITMQDGERLVEHLLEEGPRFHAYRFLDPGPVPVAEFQARITVVDAGAGGSEIHWEASFAPVPGVAAEDAAAAVGGFYRACLDKVAAELGRAGRAGQDVTCQP